jgi:hypothetical protein
MEITQEWIDQFNKKCAQFIGWKYKKSPKHYLDGYHTHSNNFINAQWIPRKHLKFHSDWNWIHEVLKKISIIYYQEEPENYSVYNLPIFAPKEFVVENINNFIDWYNEQKERKSLHSEK